MDGAQLPAPGLWVPANEPSAATKFAGNVLPDVLSLPAPTFTPELANGRW